MSHKLVSSFLLLLGLLAVSGAWARETPQWEISADSLTYIQEPEPRQIIAEGEVELSRPAAVGDPLVIRADWMSYYPDLEMVEASGRVRIESPGEQTDADSAALYLADDTGILTAATIFLADSQLYIRGATIEKTGEATYELEEAWLSACRPDGECPPAWAVTSQRARITLEGMAHLYRSTFQVREVPLAYTPYFLLPAKTKRQSGFLFPEWSHADRDGFGISLPYFVNLSPSADLTLYPLYLAERGLLAGVEFRYALTPFSRGMLVASYLNDDLRESAADDYRNDGRLRQERNRYWLRGMVDHDFGESLIGRLDLDLVSDQDFIQEFNYGSQGYNRINRRLDRWIGRELRDPSLTRRHSTLQLTKSWPDMVLFGELRLEQDLRHTLLADGTYVNLGDSPAQSLPRLDFSGRLPLLGRSLGLAWNSGYVNYWRSRGVGAHRLDLHPRLIAPLPRAGGWLEGRAGLGLRQTLYQVENYGGSSWDHDRFQQRSALDFNANLATTLVREFAVGGGGESWLEHMFRPNLIYSYLARSRQDRLPSLDGVDRLTAKNWLTYEANNYLELGGRRLDEEGAEHLWSRSLAFFKVAQTYDIEEARSTPAAGESRREFSDLRFELRANPLPRFNLRYQTNLSMYGQGVTRHELQGGYRWDQGTGVSVSYRYLKHRAMAEPYFYTTAGEEMHDIIARFDSPLTDTLTVHGYLNTSLADRHIADASLRLRYKPHCWMVDLEIRRYAEEKSFMIIFTLDSVGQTFEWFKDNL